MHKIYIESEELKVKSFTFNSLSTFISHLLTLHS